MLRPGSTPAESWQNARLMSAASDPSFNIPLSTWRLDSASPPTFLLERMRPVTSSAISLFSVMMWAAWEESAPHYLD
jgi:hypothetical protein